MPAAKRKEEIEPDIQPDWPGYNVINGDNNGDGSSAPERDSIHALDDLEKNPDEAPSPDKPIDDQEESGGPNTTEKTENSWEDKTTPREYKDSKGKTPRGMKILRKKGPLGLILGITLGGGGLIGMLFSPSLLFVQIKEIMTGKFNLQLSSMHMRTNKKIRAKIGSTTSGICTGVKILCKYQTMSAKQIAAFDKAGITVTDSETFTGRVRPSEFEFNNTKISADDFASTMKKDASFRSAVNDGYNPKFAGYSDSVWSRAAQRLGLKKSKVKLDGDTPNEKADDLQKTAKGTSDAGVSTSYKTIVDPEDGKTYLANDRGDFALDADLHRIQVRETDGIVDAADFDTAIRQVDEIFNESEDVTIKAVQEIAGGGTVAKTVRTGANIIKITGYFDDACTVYNTVRAVGYAAKTVRVFQLARYAMVFLRLADQIKAGADPDPETVDYLGNVLTKEISGAGKVLVRSATESFGYKYAAFGDRGKMPNLSTQFLAGGGLTGDIIHITDYIKFALGDNPAGACHTLANPIVSLVSLLAGGLLMYFTAGSGTGAKTVIVEGLKTASKQVSTYVSIGLVAANLILPALLKNIIAGNIIDGSTVGEKAMEAITSGSSGIMSKTAAIAGNAPLKFAEAADYAQLGLQIQEEYAEEDRLAHGPFDISNSNTFMGRLVLNLTPYIAKMSNISGVLSSISSITTNSMALAINSQTAQADTATEYKDWCSADESYKSMGLATDPYCNIIYGIPPAALDKDPIAVLNDLITEIDPNTGDPSSENYIKFVDECVNREDPLGDFGATSGSTNGSECLFGAQFGTAADNSNYYLHLIDQRVEAGMSGEDEILNAATDYGYISFYDPIDDTDSDIAVENLVKDLTIINDTEQKTTEVISDALDKPNTTINQCLVNDDDSQIFGLDVLCGYPYIGPFKNREYEI